MKRSQLTSIIREEILTLVKEGEAVKEDVVDVDDKEAHKAASTGTGGKEAKGLAAQHTAGLKAQNMKKFIQHMKDIGTMGPDGKLLDAKEYKTQFAKYNKNPAEYIKYFTDY